MKKILAILLALCMCVSLVPVIGLSAFAESTETPEATTEVVEKKKQDLSLTTAVTVIKQSIDNSISKFGVPNTYKVNFYVTKNKDAGLPGNVNVHFALMDAAASIYLPYSADSSKLFLSWDNSDITVKVGKTTYKSGELPIPSAGMNYTFSVSNGKKTSKISLQTMKGSSGVAAMFLDLDESLGTVKAMNADSDHETQCFGSANFDGKNQGNISIKGRGNSTWSMEKKPYNITFYKEKNGDPYGKKNSVELIKGVKSKKWSLLANYLDTSLMRNKIGLDLATDLGIGLDSRFVDLYMNGEFLGNYLLTPKNDYNTPDGGYQLENDNYLSEAVDDELKDFQFELPGIFEAGKIVGDGYYSRMTIKDVGDSAVEAGVTRESIQEYVTSAWKSLLNYKSEDYQKYFDIESWSKMYLMYEVCKTYDAFSGSILMHRDGLTDADKLIAGPTWDMDTTFGRSMYKFFVGISLGNQLSAEGLYIDKIGLSGINKPVSLLQELGKHASFMQQVAKTYQEYEWAFKKAIDNVYTQQAILKDSADMNNDLWGIHHLHVYFVPVPLTIGTGKYQLHYEVTKDWNAYINNLHEFISKRVMYMSDIFTTTTPEGQIVGFNQPLEGHKLVLNANVTNASNPTFQWQKSIDGTNWTDLKGQTNAELSYLVTAADNGTLYRCVVTNNANKAISFHEGAFTVSKTAILAPVQITVVSATDNATDVSETPVATVPSTSTNDVTKEPATDKTTESTVVAPEASTTAPVETTTEATTEATEPTEATTSTTTNNKDKNNETVKQLVGLLDKFIRSKIK